MRNIIEVRDVKKSYGKFRAVKGVSFDVKEGEVFGILGPNGAGKTTTLEMIETIRDIDEGDIRVDGIDVSKDQYAVKRIIGVQLQSTGFFDHLNLSELLQMFALMYNTKISSRGILDDVGLLEKAKSEVAELSGGQRQRFSIAVALVNKPKVIFLDEPTTGLDPQARHNLWDLIESIKKKGIAVVLTTHYMEEAEKLCDRIAIMDNGKILTLDTPAKLVKNLLDKGFKKKIHEERANLEDVFFDLTGKGLRES